MLQEVEARGGLQQVAADGGPLIIFSADASSHNVPWIPGSEQMMLSSAALSPRNPSAMPSVWRSACAELGLQRTIAVELKRIHSEAGRFSLLHQLR